MNTAQQARNKRSNAQGQLFEKMILQGCEHYRKNKIAEINKTPEGFRVTKKYRDGTFLGRFIGKAQPDFQGTIKNGRSIIFEAKFTLGDRINKDVVTRAQADYLQRHYEQHAWVGVCVCINKTCGFVPWGSWIDMKNRYGRQYMTEEELKEFEVHTPGMILFLDYKANEA